jgi:NAD(P)-dependent dehydrogenase (short-subunit alcohol dehydrogenase family)
MTGGGGTAKRVVVVGASSGLGRCIGIGLAKSGHAVALLARRHDRLVDAAKEAGNGALAVRCDATDEASCRAAIGEAVSGLGGIDALVYTPAIGPLARLADTDAETWRRVFDTNVVGAALVTAAALPHLAESRGVVAYLSSQSASLTPPWPGLGAYVVTKAALDKLVEAWRIEHPEIGFTRIVVGNCAGGEGDAMTEFTTGWDPGLAAELGAVWAASNYVTSALLPVEELVRVVDTVVRAGPAAAIQSVVITQRPYP